jgi:hypothetical protein
MARASVPAYAVQVTAANTEIQAPNSYSDPTLLVNTGVCTVWVQVSQQARVVDSIPLYQGSTIILWAPGGVYGITDDPEHKGEVRCIVGCVYYADSAVDGEMQAQYNMLRQILETLDASRVHMENVNKTLLRIRG